jgi:Gpi18-like mannosyltransferase
MTKAESKFFDWIEKNIIYILFVAVTILGVAARFFGIDFQSDDYNSFLNPWWSSIEAGGVTGLATQVGNYNIPYQVITYLFTLLPFGSLYSYKLISIVFDFVLAVSAALVEYSFDDKKSRIKALLTYSIVLCSLTVILNSSFWAQCDSIYVAFILLAIYFTKKDRNILAFVMLGIAFSFKLQTIFIIPVFIFYYISTRKISILHFLIIPLVDVLMCLPAIVLGRNIKEVFTIYAEQTDYGKQIQMNCPNLWALICDRTDTTYYYLFKNLSIVLAVLVLGVGLALVIYKRVDMSNRSNFLLASIWTVFTCLVFLSSMHERYGYLLDILTIIYAVVTVKRVWLPVLCQLVSLRGYCFYLFSYDVLDIKIVAVIYVAVYAYVTYMFVKDVVLDGAKLKATANVKLKK